MVPPHRNGGGGPNATTCTLGELFAGASVFVDETLFGNWREIVKDDALFDVDPRQVQVMFSEDGRRINVDILSDGGQFSSDPNEGNYLFGYDIRTKVGADLDRIDKFELSLLNYDIQGEGNAELKVRTDLNPFSDTSLSFGVFAQQINTLPDEQTNVVGLLAPAQELLTVLTRISVSGSPESTDPPIPGAGATVYRFRQSFYRVPEPGTLGLFLAAGLALVARRRFNYR